MVLTPEGSGSARDSFLPRMVNRRTKLRLSAALARLLWTILALASAFFALSGVLIRRRGHALPALQSCISEKLYNFGVSSRGCFEAWSHLKRNPSNDEALNDRRMAASSSCPERGHSSGIRQLFVCLRSKKAADGVGASTCAGIQ